MSSRRLVIAHHARRAPLYYLRILARAPHGLSRCLTAMRGWAGDQQGKEILAGLVDNPKYVKAAEYHQRKVKARRRSLVLAVVWTLSLSTAALILYGDRVSALTWCALAVAGISLLGLIGRREDDMPIIDRELDLVSGAPRVTNDLVIRALLSIGLGELTKANARALKDGTGDGFHIPAPGVIRDHGDAGYRVEVELPHGVTVEQVSQRAGRLAAGLRRPADCVWIERGKHEAYLILRVTDQSMAEIEQDEWPLLNQGRVSMFEAFPFGTDYRGEMVKLCLMYVLMIIGAMPRMGKSFSVRLIATAAALDPSCQIDCYNLKGGSDYKPLAPVCHRWRTGGDSDEDIAYVMDGLRELKADMLRRYNVIEHLDESACPEGKTTAELARNRSLGLHPRLLLMDEVQKLYEHPTFGSEGEALVIDISKRGPAAGIMVVQATQRVDADSIPKAISSNAAGRFCLKVDSHIENNLILGTGAHKNGYQATEFDFDRDKGVGYLRMGGKPFPVRAYEVDAAQVKKVVARALSMRRSEGYLTGYAAGDESTEPVDTSTILDHLAEVWPAKDGAPQARVWWEDLAKLLAGRYPLYADITPSAVRAASELPTTQVKGTFYDSDNELRTANRRGATHEDLLAALAARNAHDDEEQQ